MSNELIYLVVVSFFFPIASRFSFHFFASVKVIGLVLHLRGVWVFGKSITRVVWLGWDRTEWMDG